MKIFVASHRRGEPLPYELYSVVQSGAAATAPWPGVLHDNTGDHISSRNIHYSELTVLYWIWKNTTDDRVGLCHYRRFFSPILFSQDNAKGAKLDRDSAQRICKIDTAGVIFDAELSLADMIVPVRDPRTVSAADLYAHHHRPSDWDAMMKGLDDLYTAESKEAQRYFSEIRPFHYYNMFVSHRAIVDQYCSWLFPLLFHLEATIVPPRDPYQGRVYGFLAERLFNWWTASRGLKLVERPIIQIE